MLYINQVGLESHCGSSLFMLCTEECSIYKPQAVQLKYRRHQQHVSDSSADHHLQAVCVWHGVPTLSGAEFDQQWGHEPALYNLLPAYMSQLT